MSEKKKIIVIDDDPNLVVYLTTLLEDNGYATVSAEDGQQGLDMIRKDRPDLIVLDITMPEKSGVGFYRDVRQDADLKSIPVVMVTGVMKDFQKFISSRRNVPPPDGYFSKPIDQKEFLDAISKLLS